MASGFFTPSIKSPVSGASTGRNPDTGDVMLNALATTAYDEALRSTTSELITTYLDTELKVSENGLSRLARDR
jgi:hypothetical protein